MSRFFDLHVHTEFCDGHATAEEMVRRAIEMGCPRIGFSTHAPQPYHHYMLLKEHEEDYRAEIFRLREVYREKIEVLCGLEMDIDAYPLTKPYDYIIGTVHALTPLVDGERVAVDGPRELLLRAIEVAFGGDAYAAAEDYFGRMARLGCIHPSIIGHFDLIRKYNANNALFDETHPRYLAAARQAVDALLPLGVPFEVNTGCVARSYRDTPYPAAPILSYILKKGGRVILTGDTHSPENLCFQFERWRAYIEEIGEF